jgi:hypothetical protein
MGDHRDQFVDLDATADTAVQRAFEVRTFLRNRGLAEPDEGAADELWPDATVDRPGPAWQSTWHEYGPDSGLIPWRTIAVISPIKVTDHGVFAMDGTGPPLCRTCGEVFDEDVFWSSFEGWYKTGREPALSCASCGGRDLLGDQDTTGSAVVGRVAVVTDGATQEVTSEMLRVLRVDLGGRWAYVHMHL